MDNLALLRERVKEINSLLKLLEDQGIEAKLEEPTLYSMKVLQVNNPRYQVVARLII